MRDQGEGTIRCWIERYNRLPARSGRHPLVKRLWLDIKKHRFLLIVAAALMLVTRWLYLRGLPERMLEVTAPIQAIHNGKIYLLRQDWERADFQICPADQPVEHRIAREVLSNSQVTGMTVAENGIYYVLQPR